MVAIPSTINGQLVTSIGSQAFWGCSLTSVTIPNSVTNIGHIAFRHCASLTSITIPNSVTSIGYGAFQYGCSLSSITIGNSVTSIKAGAFQSCTSLEAITVADLNPVYSSVDGVLFNQSRTSLIQCPERKTGTYTIPNTVTEIVASAFASCSSLTMVTIPNSVTEIGGGGFYGWINVTGVYFQGNAPFLHEGRGTPPVFGGVTATVYYLPGTTGWDSTFGGLSTALWSLPNPLILTSSSSFGVQTNRFGFIISWATNIPVVVEASTTLINRTWFPVATNTLTDGWSYFSDPQWTNYPGRF